ncbi:tripartite motif-containing protein 2-like isoform X2 [Anneissia japonica]|uniref:tripartite motif-containing protein 2-like isoform X2 n=1 Tax=Anneissia japonica TaxID=1529436 RepID=UPI001425A57E|nr:tripartite motif-containing protein 2-like isoform X2 [Anneissia japonica]
MEGSIEQPNKDIQGELLLTGSTLTGETDTSKTEAGPITSIDNVCMVNNMVQCSDGSTVGYQLNNPSFSGSVVYLNTIIYPSATQGNGDTFPSTTHHQRPSQESQGATGIAHNGFISPQMSTHHGFISPQMRKSATGKALYTLKGTKDEQIFCPIHCNNELEFFCLTCQKSACKHCEHGFNCLRNKHDVLEIKTVVHDVTNKPKDIQKMLNETLDSINKARSHWEDHVQVCRAAIIETEKKIIKTVQEESKKLISELEKLDKEKKEEIDSQVKDINEKQSHVDNVMSSINKPQEIATLVSYMTTINDFRDFDESFHKLKIIPKFIELKNSGCIGTIKTVYGMFKVDKDDEAITVTKEQPFAVTVSSLIESDACKLSATLSNPSYEESTTEVEYQGNGEYKITGRCTLEGDWQMKIIVGEAHIKGSPVNIKVESLGLTYH